MDEDCGDENVHVTKTPSPNCKEWKVCIVGDMGVGKSSILTRIKDSTFSINALTTTGAIFATITIRVGDQDHKFIVWDTPGQERFRFFAPVYYRGIRAAILVYSITDRRSYRSVTGHWTASVRSHIPSDGRKIVLCLVGNKADMEEEREVPRDEAEGFAREHDAIFTETSAFTGENVVRLFEELAKRVTKVLEHEQKHKINTNEPSADAKDSSAQAANDAADERMKNGAQTTS